MSRSARETQRLSWTTAGFLFWLLAIWITLAGTSVGRGWDSVGHKQGIYRNQMTIESLNGDGS
jgi:hypothetical protein